MKRKNVLVIILCLSLIIAMMPQLTFADNQAPAERGAVVDKSPESGKTAAVKASAAVTKNAADRSRRSGTSRLMDKNTLGTYLKEKGKLPKQAPYTKGEAIVMMRNPAASKGKMAAKSQLTTLLPEGVTLKKSICFEGHSDVNALTAKGFSPQDAKLVASDLVVLLVKSDSLSTPQLVAKMKSRKDVLAAHANYRMHTAGLTNDTFSDYQWGVQNTWENVSVGGDVNPAPLWNALPSGSGKVVAVVDTGVDFSHPDLKNVAWNNTNTARLRGKHGYDFYYDDDVPDDGYGHGTHVSGIIAAQSGNSEGVSGIDKGAKIMALRVFDEGGYGEFFAILEAYDYIDKALNLGTPVAAINNSWGGFEEMSFEIFTAILNKAGEKGAVSVFAAGNDYEEVVPPQINSPYQISVAASNYKGEKADFSSYGPYVDIAAPGDNILSSVSFPTYNPTIYSAASAAAINQVFKNFNSGVPSDLVHAEYIAETWDDQDATLTTDNAAWFGPKSGNQSLKWTIPNADQGKAYHLYIPYESVKSFDINYLNLNLSIPSGPSIDEDSMEENVLLITDTKLKPDGTLPEQYDKEDYMSFWMSYTGDFLLGLGAFEPVLDWQSYSGEYLYGYSKQEDRALVFSYFPETSGEHVIRLDDIGISKPMKNAADLGKYAFMSGTSMATPFVAGGVAQIAAANPGWTPKEVVASVKGMAVPTPSFTDKVASDGIFDLSRFRQTSPYLEGANVNPDGTVTLTGSFFGAVKGSGSVTVSGAAVTTSSWSDKAITLPGANIVDRVVDFVVTADSGRHSRASLYVVGGKPQYEQLGELTFSEGGSFTTDGSDVYYFDAVGTPMVWATPEDLFPPMPTDPTLPPAINEPATPIKDPAAGDAGEAAEPMWMPLPNTIDAAKMFPDASEKDLESASVGLDSKVIWVNGKFYAILSLDSGKAVSYALASYDMESFMWSREADRPGAEVKAPYDPAFTNTWMSSLASYNGKLYFFGGLDGQTSTATKAVRVYDPKTKQWTAGPDLPAGRFLSSGNQTGDKLIVSLGGDGILKDRAPRPLIFDGASWTTGPELDVSYNAESTVVETTSDDPEATEFEDWWTGLKSYYRNINYYKAAIGLTQNGLIYGGLATKDMGDTFIYNVAAGKYEKSSRQLKGQSSGFTTDGVATDDTFWVGTFPSYSFILETGGDKDSEIIKNVSGDYRFYNVKIPSGMVRVSGTYKGGKQTGYGAYLPGQDAHVTVAPNKGYYLTKFTVDGKAAPIKYTGATASFLITKDVKADASFVKYATKISMTKKTVNGKPGAKIQLKAKVTGARAGIKTVTWKSSNKNYAVVSKTGKVTLRKAGLGRTVTITATTTDGSAKKAQTTIKIFSKKATKIVLKAKTKSVKVGKKIKITAYIYPLKGTLKAVTWKVSNKSLAFISKNGYLTATGGRGRTITVTATTTDGTKKKATIRIRII